LATEYILKTLNFTASGATSGTGTAYPSAASDFTTVFSASPGLPDCYFSM